MEVFESANTLSVRCINVSSSCTRINWILEAFESTRYCGHESKFSEWDMQAEKHFCFSYQHPSDPLILLITLTERLTYSV